MRPYGAATMTASPLNTEIQPESTSAAWPHAAQGACALAAGMGVGRFVYTPILPLMTAQAGLTASMGATLATANYLGYFLGALIGMVSPALGRSVAVHRAALVTLVLSLAGLPVVHSLAIWFALRLVAGVASAVVFVFAVSSLLSHLRGRLAHLPGWGFSGVGAGIALSGALVLMLSVLGDWHIAWWASALLCAVLATGAWTLRPESVPEPVPANTGAAPRTHRWFATLFISYTLEGLGYIIAGTFLVAAISQNSPGGVGGVAWILAGLAAVPSAVAWSWLSKRWRRPDLLLVALLVQATGIALPALLSGVAAALIAAILFGATFLGVSLIALGTGTHLRFPRSVALLTAGYSVGQILGPLVATPLLHHGYRLSLVLGAVIVLASAIAAGVLRIGFPHRLPH